MQRFRSEISFGLAAVPAFSLLLAPILVLSAAPRSEALRAMLTVSVALLPVIAFLVWIYTTTDYSVEGSELLVRSGPFKWRVNLPSVRRLRATHSMLSAPALSLNRIEITYGESVILVSPADRQGFVRAILARAPRVKLEGLDAAH